MVIEDLETRRSGTAVCYVPIVWASTLVQKARRDGRVSDLFTENAIINALNKFRMQCQQLVDYSRMLIPLVYFQVATIATLSYFLTALVGHQYVRNKTKMDWNYFDLDLVPIFIVLHFLFFMGRLKVAQSLLNPFGENDDDFELDEIINTCIRNSNLIADQMYN